MPVDNYKLEYLKRHGTEEMRVELEFSIDGRRFVIRRKVIANQSVSLDYPDEEGNILTAQGAGPVKTRLHEEVRLSDSALLNTCFVEQKELGRLEEIDSAARRATVNELLNLRTLPRLEETFRVTADDRTVLQNQKARVGIAELDAHLPELQQAAQAAHRCLLYAQVCEFAAEIERLQREGEQVEEAQKDRQTRRQEITQGLRQCEALRNRIRALEADLTLRARAWRDALAALSSTGERVRELTKLRNGLPAREAHLRNGQELAERLKTLEDLETEAREIEQQLRAALTALNDYDRRKQEWEEGETRLQRLAELHRERECDLEAAEALWAARQERNRRLPHLQAVLQHITAFGNIRHEIEQIEAQISTAREMEEALPALTARRDALAKAAERLRQREEDRREWTHLESETTDLVQKQTAHRNRLERFDSLGKELLLREQAVEAARAAEKEAQEQRHRAETRNALTEWIEASERLAETDPDSGELIRLQAERTEAEAQKSAADSHLAKAVQQTRIGLMAVGVGVVLSGIGLPLGLTGLIVAGMLVAAASALPLLRGRKAQWEAHAEREAAQQKEATLNGRIQAVQTHVNAFAAHQRERATREADRRQRLIQLGETVPAEGQEAKERLARLSALPLTEAQAHYQDAQRATLEAEHACQHTRRQHEEEELQIADYAAADVESRLASTAMRGEQLKSALGAASDLPELLQSLGITDESLETLEAARQETSAALARAVAQAEQLPELERKHAEKERQRENEQQQVQTLAEELHLPGAGLDDWQKTAIAEREELRTEKTQQPDAALEEGVQRAKQALEATGHDLTVLKTEQAQRQREMDAQPRARLESERQSVAQRAQENRQRQEPLRSLREELEAADLPLQSGALQTNLAALAADVKRDRTQAEWLPQAQREYTESETTLRDRHQELEIAWKAILPEESLPATPDEAQERLPALSQAAQQQLEALQEAALRREETTLTEEITRLGNTLVTLQHQQKEARQQRQARLAELGFEADTLMEVLLTRYPELREAAHHDVSECEQALREAREEVTQNRSQRHAAAQLHGVSAELLNLAAEKQAFMEQERRLAVKRRAGEVVEATRQSIISRVMPRTLMNVSRILPLLTEGRYQNVRWEEEKNALAVYDNQARDFQRKSVFSGGARDQISLALRLAFALATLPGEHNVRPGWLFLDEPLSSFDRQRTQALVELLTRGLIREQFAQIFLVSHSDSFDPNRFDYRLRMDNGRIAECTLPNLDHCHQGNSQSFK